MERNEVRRKMLFDNVSKIGKKQEGNSERDIVKQITMKKKEQESVQERKRGGIKILKRVGIEEK